MSVGHIGHKNTYSTTPLPAVVNPHQKNKISSKLSQLNALFYKSLKTFIKILSVEQRIKKINPDYQSFPHSADVLKLTNDTSIIYQRISDAARFLRNCYRYRLKYKNLKEGIVTLEKVEKKPRRIVISKKHHLAYKKDKIYDFFIDALHKTSALCIAIIRMISDTSLLASDKDYSKQMVSIAAETVPVAQAMNMGLIIFKEFRLRKKQKYLEQRLINDHSLKPLEYRTTKAKLFHLKNRWSLERWNVIGHIITAIASLGVTLITLLPKTPVWINISIFTVGLSVIQQVMTIKNIYANVKKIQSIKKEIILTENKIYNDSKLSLIYTYRIKSLKSIIKDKVSYSLFNNAISSLTFVISTVIGVALLIGAPYMVAPLAIVSFSLFALSTGVEIFQLFKQSKIDQQLIKDTEDLLKTLSDPALRQELIQLKNHIAIDFKMIDDQGRPLIDLINNKQITKWFSGLTYI